MPDAHKAKSVKTPVDTLEGPAQGRGRVSFEVGKGSPELVEEHEEERGIMDPSVTLF